MSDKHPVAESISGDLIDGQSVDMRKVLPVAEMRVLRDGLLEVLTMAQARGADPGRQASWVATWIAPRLAEQAAGLVDARLRVEQTDEALRAASAHIAELSESARRFGELTEQSCPADLHGGWYAPSAGRQHPCPWCLISELSGHVEMDDVDPGGAR